MFPCHQCVFSLVCTLEPVPKLRLDAVSTRQSQKPTTHAAPPAPFSLPFSFLTSHRGIQPDVKQRYKHHWLYSESRRDSTASLTGFRLLGRPETGASEPWVHGQMNMHAALQLHHFLCPEWGAAPSDSGECRYSLYHSSEVRGLRKRSNLVGHGNWDVDTIAVSS